MGEVQKDKILEEQREDEEMFTLCFQQTARDIESKMRSEARLKLFTLDPDTQVTKTMPDCKLHIRCRKTQKCFGAF